MMKLIVACLSLKDNSEVSLYSWDDELKILKCDNFVYEDAAWTLRGGLDIKIPSWVNSEIRAKIFVAGTGTPGAYQIGCCRVNVVE